MTETVESMLEALATVTKNPAFLGSFGIERVTRRMALWHERLAVQGIGRATLSTLRSFGDASGEEIGRFQADLPPKMIEELVTAVQDTVMGGTPANLSPGDVRVQVTVVACGSRLQHLIGGGPPDLEPYALLLAALDRAAVATRARPKVTLRLGVELPPTLGAGEQDVPVMLSFVNRGDEGAWIHNPFAAMDGAEEHIRLWYAEKPVEEPGVTPLPVEPEWVALEPPTLVQRPLLWIGPGETETRQFSAKLSLDPGRYLMRASFSSYEGDETVAGQNLLRGSVFSSEHTVEVRG